MKILNSSHTYLSKDIKNLVIKLENSDEFEAKVKTLRERYDGQLSEEEYNQLFRSVEKILTDFNLPSGWFYPIQELILKNSFPLMIEDEISLEVNGENTVFLGGQISPSRNGVKIVLSKRISKDRIKRWLDDHFNEIEDYFEKLDMKKMERPRWKNGKLIQKIVKMRESKDSTGKKKSFGEITEKLKKTDEDYIRTLYHRNKKRF